MPDEQQLAILRSGAGAWNAWREANKGVVPFLRGAQLRGADLRGADLHDAYLRRSELRGADLSGCRLREANLSGADLTGARLEGAELAGANLRAACLCGADLRGANLMSALLVGADLREARLDGAAVYGVAAWSLRLEGASQTDLVVTRPGEPVITVDDLELAQFIHLMLANQNLRRVIDTVTSKVVLILGRFTPERKAVLDAIRVELRGRDYVPVIFDFERPAKLDLGETVTLLARMACFIVADLTDPASVPHELHAIVPEVAVPLQPVIEQGRPYAMFADFAKYGWVLPPFVYASPQELLASIEARVIAPAEALARELAEKKAKWNA